jgi:CDP-diglyceride synthetase
VSTNRDWLVFIGGVIGLVIAIFLLGYIAHIFPWPAYPVWWELPLIYVWIFVVCPLAVFFIPATMAATLVTVFSDND